jgi:dihydrolipoamide dehydrogenase
MNGFKQPVAYHAVPACIFTFPEIATVGMSEDEAKTQGIPAKSANSNLQAMEKP